jgi:hypothetical protein
MGLIMEVLMEVFTLPDRALINDGIYCFEMESIPLIKWGCNRCYIYPFCLFSFTRVEAISLFDNNGFSSRRL